MLRKLHPLERGASLIEYGAVVVLVAAILGGLLASGLLSKLTESTEAAVDRLMGEEGPSAPPDSPAPSAVPPDEAPPDTEPQAAPEPEIQNAAMPEWPKPDDNSTWPHLTNTVTKPSAPEPERKKEKERLDKYEKWEREWEVERDASEIASRNPVRESGDDADELVHTDDDNFLESKEDYDSSGFKNKECKGRIKEGTLPPTCQVYDQAQASALGGRQLKNMPMAADHLEHYLEGSGDPIQLDMDDTMDRLPEFEERVDNHQDSLGQDAIERAKKKGGDGPVTFEVDTPWRGWGYPPEDMNGKGFVYQDRDFGNAVGSFSYRLSGEVTAIPPKEPGGEWTYEMETDVQVKKFYDWERDNEDPVFGYPERIALPYSQADLAQLHKDGLAQEYWIEGSTTRRQDGSED